MTLFAVAKDLIGHGLNYHQLEASMGGFWQEGLNLKMSVKLCLYLNLMVLMLVVAFVAQMASRKTSQEYRPS